MLTPEILKQLGTQHQQQKLIQLAENSPSAQQCAQQLRITLSSLQHGSLASDIVDLLNKHYGSNIQAHITNWVLTKNTGRVMERPLAEVAREFEQRELAAAHKPALVMGPGSDHASSSPIDIPNSNPNP
jgi:hypothetical protein